MADLSCQIFVDTCSSFSELLQDLGSLLGVPIESREITTAVLSLDVNRNTDWDSARFSATLDGFVYSRYYLDVFPADKVPTRRYIAEIVRILEFFWCKGDSAVAACDFEDRLPAKAGLAVRRTQKKE